MLDIRQSDTYAKYLKTTGWNVDIINHTKVYSRKIPLVGNVVKVQRPETLYTKKIQELAKNKKAFQIIIEPKYSLDAKNLEKMGFKKTKKPYLPSKTLLLDLTATKDELFSSLKKDAKKSILKTEGLKVEETKNIEGFRKVWKKNVGRKRYVPPKKDLESLKKIFNKNSLFLLSEDNTSGAIFLRAGKVAYYWQAFTGKEGRKNLSQYKIVWNGILWAKAGGARIFDFEGIYDSRFPDKSWSGFSHFKKSFGGDLKTYPGAFIKTRLHI